MWTRSMDHPCGLGPWTTPPCGPGPWITTNKWWKAYFTCQYTVEPLLTDTSIIRTPLYYGQFTWSPRDRNPYKAYLSKTDTSIIRTLIPVPLVSVIKSFDCNRVFPKEVGYAELALHPISQNVNIALCEHLLQQIINETNFLSCSYFMRWHVFVYTPLSFVLSVFLDCTCKV